MEARWTHVWRRRPTCSTTSATTCSTPTPRSGLTSPTTPCCTWRACSPIAPAPTPPPSPRTTLAELHGRGARERPAGQVAAYRELGDRSLYLLGCFEESLQRRIVGPGYYADMGAAAYWRVQQVLQTFFSNAFGPVFSELATQFQECVALLARVRDLHAASHPETLLRLYEEWLTTGSAEAAQRLQSRGLVLVPDRSS